MAENFFQKTKDEPLTKELAQRIMEETRGEVRGMGLRSVYEIILRKMGPESLKKLEDKMEEMGFPLKYKDIKAMGFYPLGVDTIFILTTRDVFGFREKDFIELGAAAVKFSVFFKIILKYFSQLSLVIKQIPKLWREHYTVGELKTAEVNEKEKYVILRIEDFNVHPLTCVVISGYLAQVARMILSQPATCEEVKCMARGDKCHEFLIEW